MCIPILLKQSLYLVVMSFPSHHIVRISQVLHASVTAVQTLPLLYLLILIKEIVLVALNVIVKAKGII